MFRPAIYRQFPLRRIVAALSLAGFLAVNIGFPVVEPSGKDLSAPFPCMGSACSCQSAQACWRGCCCHTNREKLVWAKQHGVKPPSFVFTAAAQEEESESHSCCAAKSGSQADSCCATKPAKKQAEAAPTWKIAFVPTIAARKCQGFAQLWVILSAAVPVARPVTFSAEMAAADLSPLPADVLLSCDHVPPTPPPRA